ncbi:MAG: dehydrogenase [Desulfurella sp.]|jgi:secreted Zn-dependent insulinase-like peptidase
METLDVTKIINQNAQELENTMKSVFETLLSLPDEEKFNNLKNLIIEVAKNATDDQYVKLCKVNLKLASSLDKETLKAFLKLRMSVSSALPQEFAQKDSNLLKRALDESDESVKQKIQAAM